MSQRKMQLPKLSHFDEPAMPSYGARRVGCQLSITYFRPHALRLGTCAGVAMTPQPTSLSAPLKGENRGAPPGKPLGYQPPLQAPLENWCQGGAACSGDS
mmetsp:Transcript_35915/g.81500  ORF Transcript_35915/g.81500 Transcript_35915/m.81500 type:complete len:100 (-) Transcript_35915:227-526(-)